MKTGIFGGAFNPVHLGHTGLAKNYIDALALDRIIFIPTSVAPHKSSEEFASNEHRINMLSLAIGREGQNARLAAKLTEWKIDVKPYSSILDSMENPEE